MVSPGHFSCWRTCCTYYMNARPLTRSVGSRGSQSSTRVDCRRLTYVRRRVQRTKRCPRTESVSETFEVARGLVSTAGPDDVTRGPRSVWGYRSRTRRTGELSLLPYSDDIR